LSYAAEDKIRRKAHGLASYISGYLSLWCVLYNRACYLNYGILWVGWRSVLSYTCDVDENDMEADGLKLLTCSPVAYPVMAVAPLP
jgi:hypothetical protein